MKGMVIGGLGILHVFLAQLAAGGGMLLCYFEWLQAHRSKPQRRPVHERPLPGLGPGQLRARQP